MNAFLITTLPNRVAEALTETEGLGLTVFDVARYGDDRKSFIENLDVISNAGTGHLLLLTYRCPHIIPASIRRRFLRCLNIHPLPLPEFAGLNPWDNFLSSGKKEGETVLHEMTEIPDTGRIISKKAFTFTNPEDARDIADQCAADMIKKFLLNAV